MFNLKSSKLRTSSGALYLKIWTWGFPRPQEHWAAQPWVLGWESEGQIFVGFPILIPILDSSSWPEMAGNQFQTSGSSWLSSLLIFHCKEDIGAFYRSNFAATSEGGNREVVGKSVRLTLCWPGVNTLLAWELVVSTRFLSLVPTLQGSPPPNWTINSKSNSRVLKMRRWNR